MRGGRTAGDGGGGPLGGSHGVWMRCTVLVVAHARRCPRSLCLVAVVRLRPRCVSSSSSLAPPISSSRSPPTPKSAGRDRTLAMASLAPPPSPSPGNSPTPSPRPSSTAGTSSSGGPSTGERVEKKKRSRGLLRDYYGLPTAPGVAVEGKGDPLDLGTLLLPRARRVS